MTDDNSNRDSELELAEAMRFWTDLEPTSDRPDADTPPTLDQFLCDIKMPTKRGRKTIDYPATKSPTLKDIAFSAAYYEGEGNCSLRKDGLIVTIGQNDREKLDILRDWFGGKVYGPYENAKGNETHYLLLTRVRAMGFMFTVFTYLSRNRRNQFIMAKNGVAPVREYKKYSKEDKALNKFFKDILKSEGKI